MTRRDLLRLSAASSLGVLANACGSPSSGLDSGTDAASPSDASLDGITDATAAADAVSDGATITARVVIIGSGFGGAVAALRLAEAGVDSIILERGRRWPVMPGVWNTFSRTTVPDRRSTWLSETTVLPFGSPTPISKYIGVLERIRGDGIDIYAGAAVGGGSIVYGGVLATPREAAFTAVFPPSITYAEMTPYYARARAAMGAGVMPADLQANDAYVSETVFRDHATAIGLENTQFDVAANWDVIRAEAAGSVPRSALNGEAIYGNNNGCKVSLDTTYLKRAEDSGHCTILPQHRVRDISQAPSGKYVVDVEQIDERGQTVATKTFECDHLFLAAGTYGTSNLLLKAKAKGLLPHLDDRVGQNFGQNGGAMFMHWGLSEATGMSQGGFAANALVDFENPVAPLVAEHAQFPAGAETHCLLYVGLCLRTGIGRYAYDAESDAATIHWPSDASATPVAAMQSLADRLVASAGGSIRGSVFGGAITINDVLSGYSYHPLGGMTIGEATDLYGRVNNYQKLYVVDGSLVPRMAGGVNPALTIMALAERCVERIIRDDFAS